MEQIKFKTGVFQEFMATRTCRSRTTIDTYGDGGLCRFESCLEHHAPVVQWQNMRPLPDLVRRVERAVSGKLLPDRSSES